MNLGIIAHNSKKVLIEDFCIAYKNILAKHEVYATGTTGRLIEEVTNLNVHKYLSGHLGGEQQMCTDIEQDQLDLWFFLREPIAPNRMDPDGRGIIRMCDADNIPVSTNLATAELLIKALE